jgi:RNA polymerase sigma-70 factor (ECF subfamily)
MRVPENNSSSHDGGAPTRAAAAPASPQPTPPPARPTPASAAARQAETMLPLVYDELRRIAADYLRQDRPDHTLQPTALVHEAFVRMLRQSNPKWNDEAHFRAVAATAMRQILVDHARAKHTSKRGGDRVRVTLHEANAAQDGLDFDVLALDEALRELAEIDRRRASVVEMHFFGGLSFRDAAGVLDIAPKTAEADWYFARAWLRKRLAEKA